MREFETIIMISYIRDLFHVTTRSKTLTLKLKTFVKSVFATLAKGRSNLQILFIYFVINLEKLVNSHLR